MVISKTTQEEFYVWFNLSHLLERAARNQQGSDLFEEPAYVDPQIFTSVGGVETTMHTDTEYRWLWYDGKVWLRAHVKAGSDATQYTLAPKIYTAIPGGSTYHRIITPRVGIQVRDTLES